MSRIGRRTFSKLLEILRIKTDLGDDAFQMSLTTSTGGRVRRRQDILNLHNGTYIVRFRIVDSADDMKLSILHKGKHLKGSPFLIKGNV